MYISNYKPHIACICETWFSYHKDPSFSNYVIYRVDRLNGKGGGLLILVHKDVSHESFPLTLYQNNKMEVQAIKFFLENSELYLPSCYCPDPSDTISNELNYYISQLGRKKLICGDFNLKHPV